jgi:F-type H+-transporting ATPase subunit b
MNLNVTLLGQMITFALLVWFTMKYIWPPITKALAERQKKIADGLAAAERGVHELALAQTKATEQLRATKQQVAAIIEQANRQGAQLIDEAKERARAEGERMLIAMRSEMAQEINRAKDRLRNQISAIALAGAEKILERAVDDALNNELIEKLIADIAES